MATYMITWKQDPRNFESSADHWGPHSAEPSVHVKIVGQWLNVGNSGGYLVVETDEPTALQSWLAQWFDMLRYEIDLVLGERETRAAMSSN